MPENVHSLDLKGIRAVCAARGLRVPEGSSRDEAISLLERHAGTSVDNEEGAPSDVCVGGHIEGRNFLFKAWEGRQRCVGES